LVKVLEELTNKPKARWRVSRNGLLIPVRLVRKTIPPHSLLVQLTTEVD
jgi:hypothetical protein